MKPEATDTPRRRGSRQKQRDEAAFEQIADAVTQISVTSSLQELREVVYRVVDVLVEAGRL